MIIHENKDLINFHSRCLAGSVRSMTKSNTSSWKSKGKNRENTTKKNREINNKKIDLETNPIVRQIELADIIQDKKNSKCRSLHCSGSRLYIHDLGLNCLYILSQNLGWLLWPSVDLWTTTYWKTHLNFGDQSRRPISKSLQIWPIVLTFDWPLNNNNLSENSP